MSRPRPRHAMACHGICHDCRDKPHGKPHSNLHAVASSARFGKTIITARLVVSPGVADGNSWALPWHADNSQITCNRGDGPGLHVQRPGAPPMSFGRRHSASLPPTWPSRLKGRDSSRESTGVQAHQTTVLNGVQRYRRMLGVATVRGFTAAFPLRLERRSGLLVGWRPGTLL